MHLIYFLLMECIWRDKDLIFTRPYSSLVFYLRSTPALIREDNELDKKEEESAREKEKRLFQKMLSKCKSSLERMFQSWKATWSLRRGTLDR